MVQDLCCIFILGKGILTIVDAIDSKPKKEKPPKIEDDLIKNF
jgi:hypothetical protein